MAKEQEIDQQDKPKPTAEIPNYKRHGIYSGQPGREDMKAREEEKRGKGCGGCRD